MLERNIRSTETSILFFIILFPNEKQDPSTIHL